MKRLAIILLLSAVASATTTITGNVKDLGANSVQGTVVRFYLRGCAGNQPRVTGVGSLVPTQGSVWYKDFVANSSGAISGTLYSTRNNAGTGNGDIECGGSYTAVWYGMQLIQNGKTGPEIPVHAKSGATLDISNVTPISTTPVVTSPTGDGTYFRLDGGNSPITGGFTAQGNNTFIGSNLFKYLNNCRVVDPSTYLTNWPGSTTSGIQEAINDASTNNANVCLDPGTYTISSTIAPKSNVSVFGSGRTTKITQASNANLLSLIDFTINGPSNSYWSNFLVDGNWLSTGIASPIGSTVNNTGMNALIIFGGTNGLNNGLDNVWMENSSGHGLWMGGIGYNDKAKNVHINSVFADGLHVINSPLTSSNGECQFCDIQNYGGFGILVQATSDFKVIQPEINGTACYGNYTLTPGTNATVTWVSGNKFDGTGCLPSGVSGLGTQTIGLRPGQFVRFNGDSTDYIIKTVNSATSLTLTTNGTTHTNVAARAGTLEPINLNGAQNVKIRAAKACYSIDSGIVLFGSQGVASGNEIDEPYTCYNANTGVSFDGSGANAVKFNVVTGGTSYNNSQWPGIGTTFAAGFQFNGTLAQNNTVSAFHVYDSQGAPTTQFAGTATNSAPSSNCEEGTVSQGLVNNGSNATTRCPIIATSNASGSSPACGFIDQTGLNRWRFGMKASVSDFVLDSASDTCATAIPALRLTNAGALTVPSTVFGGSGLFGDSSAALGTNSLFSVSEPASTLVKADFIKRTQTDWRFGIPATASNNFIFSQQDDLSSPILSLNANGTATVSGPVNAGSYQTGSNCALGGASGTASPAACSSAAAGKIAVPASQTSYTVNTTAVTANSEIIVQQITDNTGLTGSTCSGTATTPIQSARVASTSFTITQVSVASVTCFQYWIVN